ncbi:hypothetical protein TNIN_401261 [Trichonephila inaurata madagascariensis]|uniref:Uncharacterized protein n=1 Tax=Trichonephila inaurata madagascariensis TaxID=2747483 RepID=A0A8X6WRQ5_9ARAC|nr:hypothetical protein TNIN_401261 [Trichonephila inaurata madagascariensis]
MCLPNPVCQKAYDKTNAKIADVSEALVNASMKKAAAEEKIIDGTLNSVVVSSDGTWKTCGHCAVKRFAAQKKLPLIPHREKRPPKTICKDIEINMTPYKPKKSTPVQDTTDEEDLFEEEEINYRILTPSRNSK